MPHQTVICFPSLYLLPGSSLFSLVLVPLGRLIPPREKPASCRAVRGRVEWPSDPLNSAAADKARRPFRSRERAGHQTNDRNASSSAIGIPRAPLRPAKHLTVIRQSEPSEWPAQTAARSPRISQPSSDRRIGNLSIPLSAAIKFRKPNSQSLRVHYLAGQ